jgi:hypothetical protein
MNSLLAQATSFFIQCNGDKKYYGSEESICTFGDFLDLLYRILHLSITVLAPLTVVAACMYGSFLVILYGQDPKNLQKGKAVITNAVVGLLIVWGAWAALNTFFYVFNITLPCGAVWYSITPSCQY